MKLSEINEKIQTLFDSNLIYLKLLAKKNGDITTLLQEFINNNDGQTINIPSGDYYVTEPIVIPCDTNMSINMTPTTHIHVKGTTNIECIFKIGGSKISSDYSSRQKQIVQSIKGGNLDCKYADVGIIMTKTQISRVENITLYNVNIGIETQNWGDITHSTDYKILNVVIFGKTSCNTSSIGIVNNTWDNEYQHLRIYGVSTGMLFNKGGCELHNIHITTIFTSDFTLDKFHATVGINLKADWINMTQVYMDNCATQLIVENSKAMLTNCHFYWYYNDDNATYKLISLQKDSYITITNSTLDAPSKGTQIIITTNIRDYNDISKRIKITNSYIQVPNSNICDLGNNILFENKPYYGIWSTKMTSGKYYPIAVMERNYVSTTRFILNMASDLQADVSIIYTNSTPTLKLNSLLNNSTHKISLVMGNEFTYENKNVCYLFLKTDDSDVYNNAYLTPINTYGGGLLCNDDMVNHVQDSITQIGSLNLY